MSHVRVMIMAKTKVPSKKKLSEMSDEDKRILLVNLMDEKMHNEVYIQIGDYEDEKAFLIIGGWDDIATLESWMAKKKLIDPSGEDDYLDKDFDSFAGYGWGFNDEFELCSGCSEKVIRTSPDSWGWRPDFIITANGVFCCECVAADVSGGEEEQEAYIEDKVNNPNSAVNTSCINDDDLERMGFERVNEYKERWTGGLRVGADNPRDVYKQIREKFPDAEILFVVEAVGQFDIEFTVFVRGVKGKTVHDAFWE